MKLLTKFFILGFVASLMLSSCDENRVFEEHSDLKMFRWYLADTIAYDVHIADNNPKNVMFSVRHNYFFEYRNIISKIFITTPDGTLIETSVDMLLAEPNGLWYGECSGDICDMVYPVPEYMGYSFPDTGMYHFDIVHDMRQDPLLNVMSVGLRVENVVEK